MKRAFFALCLLACPAQAEFVLQLPLGAKEVYSQSEPHLRAQVPSGPFSGGALPRIDAPEQIRRTVWQMGGEQTLQGVLRIIRDQLQSRGYDVVLDCVAAECGGFDFRFAIDVVPEPEMWVDLRRFRFITARQAVIENPGFVTFLISRSPATVFVQMTEYLPTLANTPAGETPVAVATAPASDERASTVLEGLEFDSGATGIASDPQGAIADLARIMKDNPDLNVLLVGHSDMSGSLDANVTVSRQRAESVRQLLISEHGVDPDRLSAHGIGFLSPRASNETDAGRQENRRVEAVFSR